LNSAGRDPPEADKSTIRSDRLRREKRQGLVWGLSKRINYYKISNGFSGGLLFLGFGVFDIFDEESQKDRHETGDEDRKHTD